MKDKEYVFKDNIKIGAIEYKIIFVENLARDMDSLGRCCGNNRTIEIDKNLDGQIKEKVLIHEIIEAINIEYEFDFEHNIISKLATILYQILIDNDGILIENEV
jgi:hypothetical protein